MRRRARPEPPAVDLTGDDAAVLAAVGRADAAAVAEYDRLDPLAVLRAAALTVRRRLGGRARLVLRQVRRLARR